MVGKTSGPAKLNARRINLALLAFLSIAVVLKLRLDLIVRSTTPTGGDNGGHVWTADYVRREMLPKLRLTGWSNDWFGGVPVLGFYFPVPTWLIVALSFVLPYNVAYKLVTIVGIATFPLVCHRLGGKAGLNPTRSLFLGLSAFPFLFARHFRILGGNILSTMAGEFSFSISLTLAVLYAGLLLQVLRTGQRRSSAAAVLALAGLSHIVPTLFALAFTLAATVVELKRDTFKRQLADVVSVGAVGGLCAGFWLIPFAKNLPYSNSMDYERYTRFLKTLFPFFADSSSLQTPKDGMLAACAALVLAGLAVLVGWIRRDRFVMIFTLTMAIVGIGFRLSPQSAMWNIRLLPLWFFCAYVLAGQAVGVAVHTVFTRRRRRRGTRESTRLRDIGAPAMVGTVFFIALCGCAMQILPPFLPLPVVTNSKTGLSVELGRLGDTQEYRVAPKPFGWAASNAQGAQKKSGWPEYRALLQALKPLPCGRALWEPDKTYTRFGSAMVFMQLPYWTNSCIQSSEGLYFEASATAPFHWLTTSLVSRKPPNPQRRLPYQTFDMTRGVERMRQLGIRYYLAHSAETKQAAGLSPDLSLVATSGTFSVYEIAGNTVVAPLLEEPVVVTGIGPGLNSGFIDVGIAQWIGNDNAFPSTMVTSGPSDWIRRRAIINPPKPLGKAAPKRGIGVTLTPAENNAATRSLPPVVVSKVVVDPMSVRFHVDRTGVPVLVRISWFPNWKTAGAAGPYRAMPNYMVVIPTRNDVVLTYGKTDFDHLGSMASVVGLIGLAVLRRKNGPAPETPVEGPTTAWPDLEVTGRSDEESAYEPVGSPQF